MITRIPFPTLLLIRFRSYVLDESMECSSAEHLPTKGRFWLACRALSIRTARASTNCADG
ncbi:Uncharacterised protein [Vibrio cholerae]|nr:Uncharacterised protein [Vibrio cholerae]